MEKESETVEENEDYTAAMEGLSDDKESVERLIAVIERMGFEEWKRWAIARYED